MTIGPAWWYSLPGSLEVDPELYQYYARTIFPHYCPSPYVMYAGPAAEPALPHNNGSPDSISVCVLGDSTVADPQLCSSLQNAAEARHLRCVFHNRGVIAANSGMALARMLHQTVDERPDVVIVVGGGIDILTPLSFDPRPGCPHIHFVLELLFEHFHDPAHNSLWTTDTPLSSGLLRERFFDRIAQLRHEVQFGSPQWETQILSVYQSNIRKMFSVAAAFNFKLIYVLQPLLLFKTALSDSESEALPSLPSRIYITRQYQAMEDILNEEAAQRLDPFQSRIADCHDIFQDQKDNIFMGDIIHYDSRAAGLLADAIVSRINDWLDPARRAGSSRAPSTKARRWARKWMGQFTGQGR